MLQVPKSYLRDAGGPSAREAFYAVLELLTDHLKLVEVKTLISAAYFILNANIHISVRA